MAAKKAPTSGAAVMSAQRAVTTPRSPALRWAAAASLMLCVGLAGYFTWRTLETQTDPSILADNQVAPSPRTVDSHTEFAAPKVELAADDPRRNYFGVEIGSGSVAYVVDDHPAMKPYIKQLAEVTNLVNSANSGEFQAVIVRPTGRRPSALLGFAESIDDKSDVDTKLSTTLPPNRQDLTYAFGIAVGRSPDAIFLVLAHALEPEEINRLAQAADQAGTATHIVAIGSAARQDLSLITSAGGGQFVQLTNPQFNSHVQSYRDAAAR